MVFEIPFRQSMSVDKHMNGHSESSIPPNFIARGIKIEKKFFPDILYVYLF
jgi:hypothetical protein